MKRLVSIFIIIGMILTVVGVSADDITSKDMERVLLEVKQRVDIPEKFTEFSASKNEYDGNIEYEFMWNDEDHTGNLTVVSDNNAHIKRYYFYDNELYDDGKTRLVSKNEVISFADSFLRKIEPQAFSNPNDLLVLEEDSWLPSNSRFQLRYERKHNGINVLDNYARISVVVCDDVMYISNVNINFDFDTEFDGIEDEADNIRTLYKKAFPSELIYMGMDRINPREAKDDKKAALVYRFKDNHTGYILASNGEIAEPDTEAGDFYKFASAESAGVAMDLYNGLSPKEIKKLDEIKGLMSTDEAKKLLAELPLIKITSDMKMSNSNITDYDGQYRLSIGFEGDDGEFMDATFDAKKKSLISYRFYGNDKDDKEITEKQQKEALSLMEDFLKKAAPDEFGQYKLLSDNVSRGVVSAEYNRYVNDIRFIDNSIRVSYDSKSKLLQRFDISYSDDVVFDNPDNIIDENTAYDSLIKYAELDKKYVKIDGSYKKCFCVKNSGIDINAHTGEMNRNYYDESKDKYEYNDLEGHWAKDIIEELAENGIGFSGDSFKPEEYITQADLLRLFAIGVHGQHYSNYDEEALYESLKSQRIISKDEISPNDSVKREKSFVYMVRMDGHDSVAKLENIYKVDYADGNEISDGYLGYAAILTGMNIICGDGGSIRPQDCLTRAEAAVMIYNYMNR